jgi:uncharacterized membrane protein HdeD (DUF308 family)
VEEAAVRAELAIFRRLPRWVSLTLGLACVVAGVVLVTRPFTSQSVLVMQMALALIVTGVLDVVSAPVSASSWLAVLTGAGWIVAGILWRPGRGSRSW